VSAQRRVALGAVAGAATGLILVGTLVAAFNSTATEDGIGRDGLVVLLLLALLFGASIGVVFADSGRADR
jgi:hypothetical protein